jgi:hypothetical protein
MTPYQLDESANAPCTSTMVGLAGCAVAAAPVSNEAHECPHCHEDPHLNLPLLARPLQMCRRIESAFNSCVIGCGAGWCDPIFHERVSA